MGIVVTTAKTKQIIKRGPMETKLEMSMFQLQRGPGVSGLVGRNWGPWSQLQKREKLFNHGGQGKPSVHRILFAMTRQRRHWGLGNTQLSWRARERKPTPNTRDTYRESRPIQRRGQMQD